MVDEQKKKRILIISFVLATFLFLAGFGLGYAFDTFRTAEINKYLTQTQLDMESFLMQQQLLSQSPLDANACAFLKSRFLELQSQRTQIGRKLESYDALALSKTDLLNLKRKHIILSVNSLIVMQNLKQSCGQANFDVILFFYAPNQQASTNQGLILDEVYNRFPDQVSIFALDASFDQEPLISLLKSRYNVTRTPTIIVNDNKLEGFTDLQDILKYL